MSDEAKSNFGTLTPLVSHLLFHRGVKSTEEAEKFLSPDYDNHVHDPFLMKDMERSVLRILKAMKENERIAIYSDYDSDGIPCAVIFHDFFKKIGYENFENYIPHRELEGFGLHIEALNTLKERGVKLVITADCGIADVEQVKHANTLGIDVIITDHHEAPDPAPSAFAILNPKQKGCEYPDKNLCGAGVVFKLIQALCSRLRSPLGFGALDLVLPTATFPIGWEKWLLDLVGLATLSDMVPLVGENRAFAHYGLKVLRKTPRIGLRKLFSAAKVNQQNLVEDDIGFTISPRINAASRMGDPRDAFLLLSTTDENEADTLAKHLVKLNDERKGVVAAMVREMRHGVGARYTEEKPAVIVMGNPKWRPSLLGLVANTFMQEHNCPVFVWGREGGSTLKGSCRSNGSVSLIELMQETDGVFEQFGGHQMSGGFTLTLDAIEKLEHEIERAYEKLRVENKKGVEEILYADKRLKLSDINFDFYNELEKLSPFGVGNPKPLFLFERVFLKQIKQFGKEKTHIELVLAEEENGQTRSAIKFFTKPEDLGPSAVTGERINLVAALEKSTFRGFPELRLRIVDII